MRDDVTIRRLDPDDRGQMRDFQRVYVEAERQANPGGRLYTEADGVAVLRPSAAQVGEGYGGYVGDRMVGELLVLASHRADLDRGRLLVWVSPSNARQGVGGRLLGFGEERLRELGRSFADANAVLTDPGYGRFARRHGYRLVQESIERRLDLPADGTLLDRLEAEAAPMAAGYDVAAIDGPIPPELADDYAELINRVPVDAPTGDIERELGRRTAEDIAEQDRELVESGQRRVTGMALRDGRVVAFACAVVGPEGHDHVNQWATIVAPAHRGHRLGVLVKVAQLRALGRLAPDKAYLRTDNAEANEHMIAINEALGFRVTARIGEFEKRLG